MMKPIRGLLLAAIVSTCLTSVGHAQTQPPAAAKDAPIAGISMPAEEFTLPNGLRVIVHTDRSLPLVAVAVWYNVGAANETAGHTGFAHLFEHLMFQGSENFKDEFFKPFRDVGATDQNGSTSHDWTNYYQTVPTPALDMALWMESDRMGHLLGAVDQKTLDEQRGVVQNEKRQRYDRPYGLVNDRIMQGIFPKGHPYNHQPIGSMADLNAASLNDVKNWFRSWYGPNNAVLTLAGDIDLATAKEKAMKYFGDIAPSATTAPAKPDVPVLAKNTREIFPDKVPQNAIFRAWAAPENTSEESSALTMLSYILGTGDASRLSARLVQKEGVAVSAGGSYSGQKLAGTFMVTVAMKDGVDPAKAEKIIDEEIRRIIDEGPTQAEVDRARTSITSALAKQMPKLAIRSMFLTLCGISGKPADCWRKDMEYYQSATPEDLRKVAARWLTRPSHTVEVTKSDVSAGSVAEVEEKIVRTPVAAPPADTRFKATGQGIDRTSGVPKVTGLPDFKFPEAKYATMSNGIKVKLFERHGAPLVSMMLMMEGGPTEDWQATGLEGRAAMAMDILNRGTARYDAVGLAARQQQLGASLSGGAGGSNHYVFLDSMKTTLPQSLELLSDMMFNPTNPEKELALLKDKKIASIRRGRVDGMAITGRVSGPIQYGKDHPAGTVDTEEEVNAITRDQLVEWQRASMVPDGAVFIIVGDTTLAEIVPMLEKQFGSWKPAGPVKIGKLPIAKRPAANRIFLVDLPGAQQSQISVSQVMPKLGSDMPSSALTAGNGVLGGGFLSRLNLNLREDKHWAYGASSSVNTGRDQSSWGAMAPVQADKTAESMREIFGELTRMIDGRAPITEDDIARQKATLYGLPGSYDTNNAVLQTILINMLREFPDNYTDLGAARLRQMTPALAQEAFSKGIDPNALTWIVVGPLDKIEAPIRALGLGEVTVLDVDAKPVVRKPVAAAKPAVKPKKRK